MLHGFIIRIGLPVCHGAEGPCFHLGKKRRQATMYHNDTLNWAFACDSCMEIIDEHWQERWDEYWSGVI